MSDYQAPTMVRLRDSSSDAGGGDNSERLACLDAVRGVFLLLFISSGFGLRNLDMLDQTRWGWLTDQWTHRVWEGCTLWDLLQPALLFCVGVAMPYSYANRLAKGQNWIRQFAHALKRAVLLILIGMFLDAFRENRAIPWDNPLRWLEFRGDLQQIGLAYLLAFLVLPMGMSVQGVTVAFLLIGHTAAYVIYVFAGGHEIWDKTQHLGAAVDQWLRLAPHAQHYVAFNAIGAAAVILFGVLVSGLIRGGLTAGTKVAIMTGVSLFLILFGWLLSGGNGWIELHWPAAVPMVKRLMTGTFVFTSVGWTLLVFTYFYLIMEGFPMRGWALPLVVFGRNALFLFVSFTLVRETAAKLALLVLPSAPALALTLRPLFVELIVILLFWLVCLWLYRRQIFFKV